LREEENWWEKFSKVEEKEMDDVETLETNESDSKRDNGKGFKPHKAVFHAECITDCQ
jgi:hypothetical protein